jgi:hypothetical protein
VLCLRVLVISVAGDGDLSLTCWCPCPTCQDKLTIVKRLRARKEIVAVTGDGVNDSVSIRGEDTCNDLVFSLVIVYSGGEEGLPLPNDHMP